jgi:shikimate dehydrogenase
MRKYGLIGFPLSHSFSPAFFEKKFKDLGIHDCEYLAYPIQHVLEVQQLVSDGICGFNVTIPYKEDIIDLLDELEPSAEKIKAVNCVKVINGRLIGYNTDTYGFQHSLIDLIGMQFNGKALVLGTGGAAKAVCYVLDQLGIEYDIVSRKSEYLSYQKVTKQTITDHLLIINSTPLGMHPKISEYPKLPYNAITEKHFLYDLVYNPRVSKFLEFGLSKNASVKNGEDMLILQAEKSWEIWNQ